MLAEGSAVHSKSAAEQLTALFKWDEADKLNRRAGVSHPSMGEI